ncbi:MAG: hypothetical protein G01um101470_207, partial [Parcubacteria group bacterium Gr01-1014_70]
ALVLFSIPVSIRDLTLPIVIITDIPK